MILDDNSPEQWEYFKKKLSALVNFDFDNYCNNFLRRRIEVRLKALNISRITDYLSILGRFPDEKNLLIKELTIPVTEFFRNREAHQTFIAGTMMELLSEKEKKKQCTLKIWSAGCASGEEPYTISMILHEILQGRLNDFIITIIATDLSSYMIEKAEKGIYEPQQLKEVPEEYVKKYFDIKDNMYLVKPEVKKNIRFEVGDIITMQKPKCLDVIFCRNTIIYFQKALKEKLYMDFYECLRQGGFLVIGMTETLIGPAKDLFRAYNNIYRIYKKEAEL
ncbi:protein-glutamate O-methyltransferase CheR [Candidatus Woesearchaeota archaeon]|nr:protein-glutamate O-methyltransferase CheR [Candidatus Woesearchaeota archaeon]